MAHRNRVVSAARAVAIHVLVVVVAAVVRFVRGAAAAEVSTLAAPFGVAETVGFVENPGVRAVRLRRAHPEPLRVALRLLSSNASDALHRQQALPVQALLVVLVRQGIQRAQNAQRAQRLRARLAALLGEDTQE